MTEAITVNLGDASTNTTPKKLLPFEESKISLPSGDSEDRSSKCESSTDGRNCGLVCSDTLEHSADRLLHRSKSATDSQQCPQKSSLLRCHSSPFSGDTGHSEGTQSIALDLKIKRCSSSQIYVCRPLRYDCICGYLGIVSGHNFVFICISCFVILCV